MGACFVEPQKNKAKDKEKAAYSRMSVQPGASTIKKPEKKKEVPAPPPSPFKQLTEEELIMKYSMEELTATATTLEGPKIIVHRSTGALKVLRIVVKVSGINEERILKFKNLTNSETFMLGDFYVVISEFLPGKNILEHMAGNAGTDCLLLLRQVHAIIQSIHREGIYHGNLTFESFRLRAGSQEVGLAEMNFHEKGEQLFGSLHKNTPAADWEFFGMLLHIALTGGVPYFSKEALQYKNIGNPAVEQFLQGKDVGLNSLTSVMAHNNISRVVMAYTLRNGLFRMLKLRQKRRRFESKYLYDKQSNSQLNFSRPLQEQRTRLEKNRMMNLLKEVMAAASNDCEQDYLFLTLGGQRLNEFVQVLRITNFEKRLEEVVYKLSSLIS